MYMYDQKIKDVLCRHQTVYAQYPDVRKRGVTEIKIS